MFNIIDKIKSSAFWKSVVTLSMGQIIAQCINLFSVPIISRIYNKNAYGEFGILVSTATIIIGFIGLGLGSAIMIARDEREADKVFQVAFTLQLILATLIVIVLFLIWPFQKMFSTNLPYPTALIIMYSYIILTVLSSLLTVYINRLKLNQILFMNPLIGALSTLLLTLPLGMMGYDSVGLYIANITSLLLMNIHMLRKKNPFTKLMPFKEWIIIIKKLKAFILYQYPSNLLGTFTGQMPNQILARNYGNAALGDYAMCERVFGLPFALIATPIQTVYFRTVAQKHKDGQDIAQLTFSLVTKLLLIAFVPIGILMIFGEGLFVFVLGEQWGTAGRLASILSLQYIFLFCYNCITYCRVTIGKQKINLYVSIMQIVMIVLSLVIGVTFFGTLVGTITCFAVCNTVFSIANITITFMCLKKYTLQFLAFSICYCISLLTLCNIRILF